MNSVLQKNFTRLLLWSGISLTIVFLTFSLVFSYYNDLLYASEKHYDLFNLLAHDVEKMPFTDTAAITKKIRQATSTELDTTFFAFAAIDERGNLPYAYFSTANTPPIDATSRELQLIVRENAPPAGEIAASSISNAFWHQRMYYVYKAPHGLSYVVYFSTMPHLMRFLKEEVVWTLVFLIYLLALLQVVNRHARKIIQKIYAVADFLRNTTRGNMKPRLTLSDEDEFQIIAANINKLLDNLQEKIDRKTDFTANAAHQLRNPVAAMRVSAECISNYCENINDAKQLAADITRDCNRMKSTIDRLLQLSQLDEQNYAPEDIGTTSISLAEVLQKQAQQLQLQYLSKDISINWSLEKTDNIVSSKTYVIQIIHNLIDNALKYSPDNGAIGITLQQIQDRIKIAISNSGEISAEDLPKIWDRFYRGKATSRAAGSGLGLAIAKNIAKIIGCDLSAQSENGITTFTLILPTTK